MNIDKYIDFNPVTIAPSTLLKDAVISLANSSANCLLIVTANKLVGILTQSDVVRLVAIETDLTATTVVVVMTQPVSTMLESQCQSLSSIRLFFQQNSVNYLPIVKEDCELIGIINADSFFQSLLALPDELMIGQTAENTNHKQQKKIQELERFFDFTPSMICVAGFDGYFKQVNLAFQKNLGFTEAEITTKPLINFVHSEDRAATITELTKLSAGKTTVSFENRYRTKNGNYRWMLWTAKPDLVEQTIFCIAQDITEQKTALQNRQQAEEKLAKSENLLRTIIESEPECVKMLDRHGTLLEINPAGLAIIEADSPSEVVNKSVYPLIHPNHRQAFIALTKGVFEGKSGRLEFELTGLKGTTRWLETNAVPLREERGDNITALLAVTRDITQQRKVWNKLEFQYRQTKLLTEITDKIRMSIAIDDILQTTVTEVQQLLTCDRVLIVEVNSHNTVIPLSEAVLPELSSMLGYEIADPLLVGKYSASYHQGKVLAIDNLTNASIEPDIKQLLKQFQIQAKLVVPILAQGNLKGLLIAHQCHNPRQWQKSEIQLLNQLAERLGVALSQAELFDYAENLVSERTKELIITNELLQSEIAERKQTEQDLRENQDKLAGILDNADEAIITINERQQIQLFNQGAEKIFGYQAEEIIGQPLDILLPKIFRQVHRHHVNQFGKVQEQSRKMAERNRNVFGLHKDGHEFPAEASVAKLETRSGMLFTVMLKDISQRQQTQDKLETSKELLAKAEKIALIGSWEHDHETKQRSWSDELYNILGFTKNGSLPPCQEILGRIHPEDLLLVKNALFAGHRQGKAWELNYRLLLPDGTLKYVESRGEPTLNSEGKVIKVLETIMDVSDRIQTEKSLQRSEEQLRLITDALPILIAYIDAQQRYIYNNRTYETWYGKPRLALQGKTIKSLVGKDNYQAMLPYIETALAGKVVTFESQIIVANGSSCWISATYIPDLDADGQVKGFFSMIDDITERKAVERMKSEFISIASHEMRTPLTSIHGVVKLLCADRLGELSDRGRTMAEMALRNSDRLVHLVNDILDLERMESGRDEITKTICNDAQLIQQAIDTVSSMAKEQGITLVTNGVSLEFAGDRDRLTQTLINLISNAIKFSSNNSQVAIASGLQGDNILFSVADQGRGIPTDKLGTIFERFQQVDASDSRQKGGTGLGLAICRHIVEQHGGKIWVESVYGQGSTFYFTIPLS